MQQEASGKQQRENRQSHKLRNNLFPLIPTRFKSNKRVTWYLVRCVTCIIWRTNKEIKREQFSFVQLIRPAENVAPDHYAPWGIYIYLRTYRVRTSFLKKSPDFLENPYGFSLTI